MYGIKQKLTPSQVHGIHTKAGDHIYHTVPLTHTKRNANRTRYRGKVRINVTWKRVGLTADTVEQQYYTVFVCV